MKWLALLIALPCAAQAQVKITDAWARATLPHQDEAAAYLTLQSATADALTRVDSPQAGMAMLHQSSQAGGMAKMRDIDQVPLPAHSTVVLAPNGTHIMLMDLKHPLKPGDTLHLTIAFAHSGAQHIDVPVRPVGATGP